MAVDIKVMCRDMCLKILRQETEVARLLATGFGPGRRWAVARRSFIHAARAKLVASGRTAAQPPAPVDRRAAGDTRIHLKHEIAVAIFAARPPGPTGTPEGMRLMGADLLF